MIWGDPHQKRNTDHWGCCRPDLHAKNARERASATCPDGAAAPKRPRNARAPRRWFFEDTPRWREVNELPTNEFIIVVRRDNYSKVAGQEHILAAPAEDRTRELVRMIYGRMSSC